MLKERAKSWRHVFKLDPNRVLSDRALERICQSDTDAIIIGGTDGITFDNTWELLTRVRRYPVECVQEISKKSAVVPGFDGYLIPTVLNSGSTHWIVGAHHEAVKIYGTMIPWEDVMVLGYVVLNPESKVARLTKSRYPLDKDDVTAYARMAEYLFGLPVFYVEYSGTFGEPDIVRAARKGLAGTRLFYGGGIQSEESARTMAKIADTVVVGNLVYYNVDAAVQTVKWVKETDVEVDVKSDKGKGGHRAS
ncbi:heptaprenylglyceryl phosphate synthase [Polycladomyces subterraneus]|uniref:Heptaprenylglyceryl phosphate synthase n=1 Tax=Polycladomyces subterraneus TaxID=1016997 RepID=A0ABT8IPD6_9BACL|nr:heptaprenylglyceryl phosphate synthase [Polycladomyces subterraneus]MDN4594648.1 heptaprenylglyceryl phosphate synthase [Polycladomyces subterraneus]